jgi:sugar phosphate isomerase/epimerase
MDITLSMLSLRGARFDQPARFTALERAKAAHDAGFTSIGLEYNDPTLTSDVLDWVNVPELEWVNVDRPVPDDVLNDVIKVALMLQSTRINVGVGIGTDSPVPEHDVVRNVTAFADALSPYGMMVALEPIAFGWLPRVAEVCKIVRLADRPNLGLLLDIFHVHADPTWTHENVPASMIAEVQLAGVPMVYPEGKHGRFMAAMDRPSLADSRMPVKPWLDHLINDRGYTGPVSYELPHAVYASMELDHIAASVAADITTIA